MTQYAEGSLFYYAPNKVAPIIFSALFLLSGLLHFYQTYRYKLWKTTGLMPWAALLLTAGFVLREVAAFKYSDVNIFIATTVLIMSGPPVYAAINYLILSRVLYYVPYLSPIHPGRVLTTFLAADGVCETLIGNGASRMANANLPSNQRAVGENLVKAALIMQACLFMLFILLAIVFQRRASKSKVLKPNIQTVLIVMYISCTIITVRCIYRIVEFFLGYTGYIYTHEPFFWVFEASIMFANTAMLNIWHPGRYFPQSNKVFLSKDGQTELRGPGWSDDRPFIVTFFDPFDLYGLFTGRDSATKFWELSPEELAAMDAKAKEEKARKAERRHPMLAKAFKYTNTRSQEVVGSPFQKPSADNLEV